MDHPDSLEAMAEEVLALEPELSRLVLAFYSNPDLVAESKEDGTPVTAADLAADGFLLERLPRIVNVPVVSEEREDPAASRQTWRRWSPSKLSTTWRHPSSA